VRLFPATELAELDWAPSQVDLRNSLRSVIYDLPSQGKKVRQGWISDELGSGVAANLIEKIIPVSGSSSTPRTRWIFHNGATQITTIADRVAVVIPTGQHKSSKHNPACFIPASTTSGSAARKLRACRLRPDFVTGCKNSPGFGNSTSASCFELFTSLDVDGHARSIPSAEPRFRPQDEASRVNVLETLMAGA